MIYFIVATIVLVIDQMTKWFVVRYMELGESIPIIEPLFSITSHRNAGAAFGILQNQRLFFIVVTTVIVIGIIYYLLKYRQQNRRLSWALALILGGALGNFVDRLLQGEVVDFLDVKIPFGTFTYDYPIFNVADSSLVIGVGIIMFYLIREAVHDAKQKKRSKG